MPQGVAPQAIEKGLADGDPHEVAPLPAGEDAHAAPAPADPAGAAAPAAGESLAPDPTPPPNPRDHIVKRFMQTRADHDAGYKAQEAPPFVAKAERDAAAAAAAPSEPGAAGSPDAAAPAQPYTLRVRGRDMQVTRDELVRAAELEHGDNPEDFTDTQLVKFAQKNLAANSYLEEAKNARGAPPAPAVAAPAEPVANNGGDKPPTLREMALQLHDLQAYGTAEEYADALEAYTNAKNEAALGARDEQSRNRQRMSEIDTAIKDFASRNADITGHPDRSDLLLQRTCREMAMDLKSIGVSDQDLNGIITNPALMTQAYNAARDLGHRLRSPEQILSASGGHVRRAFGIGEPAAPVPKPHEPVASAREAAKRALPAQPTRSGVPVETVPQPTSQETSRKAALARMQAARTAPNVPRF